MLKQVTLALTGASGAPYALRLLQCLVQADYKVYLLASSAARVVLKTEQQQEWPGSPKELSAYLCRQYGAIDGQIVACGKEEWFSPVASAILAMASLPNWPGMSSRSGTSPQKFWYRTVSVLSPVRSSQLVGKATLADSSMSSLEW